MGVIVGLLVGRRVGVLVGQLVGLIVGILVGLIVGRRVGVIVRLLVGAPGSEGWETGWRWDAGYRDSNNGKVREGGQGKR